MKMIPLTQGQVAIVDDSDHEELSRFRWYASWAPNTKSFYALRNNRLPGGRRTVELMHRRILGLKRGDKGQVDHVNHRTLDNRRSNIRIVTHSENQHNRRHKGYYWHKTRQRYRAQIMVNGVSKHLGFYNTPDEARSAYLAAKAICHPTAPRSEV